MTDVHIRQLFRRSKKTSVPKNGHGRAYSVRFAALVGLLGALLAAALSGVMPDATSMLMAAHGPFGPAAIVVVVALLLAALVPRMVLAVAAGLLFGALPGAGYVMAGGLLGAVVAFEIARWLGRDFIGGRRRVAVLDAFLQRHGVLGVLMMRLLPIAPFGLVSYAFGVTAVRRATYLLATALGIAPGTLAFAMLGATAMSPTSPVFLLFAAVAAALTAAGWLGARLGTRRAGHRPCVETPLA